ncbi:sensor histidine kinase [Mongoliibacter ruber]|uniref:Histidine kinase n=1 Tax=Mongoliibacter ruber TaxID=1750599 RepID=A0A2T0WQT7_9BACT|nr:histidine kinase [Mongoliibacter ruber]PRY89068.1 histidine kinase [Mongoliibacter ruber]
MGKRLFIYSNTNIIIIMAAITLWIAATSLLINNYGQSLYLAIVDTAVYTFFIFMGLFILDNIFRYFSPKNSKSWLILGLPVFLAIGFTYLADWTGKFVLAGKLDYLYFSAPLFPLKLFIVVIVLVGWTLILVFHGRIEDQLESKERLDRIEQMAKEAELYQLRQQLQPHFLFNSLNSVSALIKKNPEQAREMIFQLADFLRGTIHKNEKKWITVAEEKEFLELFLSIEKVRFGHRLETTFDVDEASMDLKIPQLLLQPILENAIKHGLYGLTGDVLITVKFTKTEGSLLISISNPFNPNAGKVQGSGFGLEAVARRLFLIFGRNDLLNIQQKEDNFTVDLKIPQIDKK